MPHERLTLFEHTLYIKSIELRTSVVTRITKDIRRALERRRATVDGDMTRLGYLIKDKLLQELPR